MKLMFIEARSHDIVTLSKEQMNHLPQKIGLFSAIQFLDSLPEIKKQLGEHGKEAHFFKGAHVVYEGQLLGCSIDKYDGVDAFLYVGDGNFHPLALAVQNDKPIYILNPRDTSFRTLSQEEIRKVTQNRDVAIKTFFTSTHIGVVISTKYGQNYLKKAQKVAEKYPDKKFYYLFFDTVDFTQLENFNFIQCFLNGACSRIAFDDYPKFPKPVVSLEELQPYLEASE